jgi:hypothetical protein
MFPRMNITTPLPSFAYCAPQYGAGVGFGVFNPIASHIAPPFVSSPSPIPYPMIGQSPYAVQPMLPCPPVPISGGIGAWCPPLSANPYAFAQPTPIHPAMAPAFGAASPAVVGSPVACCIDPVTGAVVPQPYPVAQSLLPVRPLVTSQVDPVQMAALCGVMAPQAADPYSVMAQACLAPPLAVSPVQAGLRPPVYLSPVGSPQIGMPWTVAAGIPC